jgi:diguanylate cyclase (GGDEF)-like protein
VGLTIATLFALIILVSWVLAAALAVASHGRTSVLRLWAAALVAHGVAYVLFALRGQISGWLSVVLGNVLLAIMFVLFMVGVARFQQRRLPAVLGWGPVVAMALLCAALLPYSAAPRVVGAGLLFAAQSGWVCWMLWQRRHHTPGRGQYILMSGFAFVLVVFALRIGATLKGHVQMVSILQNNPVQQLTFLSVVVALMLLAMGLALMVHERSEAALLETQALLQQQNQALGQYATELQQANQQLEVLSITDGMTGLFNRRHFDQVMEAEWARALRQRGVFSVLMTDVDCFKAYNDHYGHQAGDACLIQVAQVLQAFARRPGDVAARYGGEEFVLLLAQADAASVQQVAESIRQAVQALCVPHKPSPWGVVTVSVGVASVVAQPHLSAEDVLKLADDALYVAKAGGRNVVQVASGG